MVEPPSVNNGYHFDTAEYVVQYVATVCQLFQAIYIHLQFLKSEVNNYRVVIEDH